MKTKIVISNLPGLKLFEVGELRDIVSIDSKILERFQEETVNTTGIKFHRFTVKADNVATESEDFKFLNEVLGVIGVDSELDITTPNVIGGYYGVY